jgi:flagellar protein FlaJ
MEFRIPFTFSSVEVLKKRTKFLSGVGSFIGKNMTSLGKNLKSADAEITKEEYATVTFYTFIIAFIILSTIFTSILGVLNARAIINLPQFYFAGLGLSILFSMFIFYSQINYPRLYVVKEGRLLDKNLLPALQDIAVQLNSGVPLFDIIYNISNSDYGEVSRKFKRIVRDINAGKPQAQAIEDVGKRTSSMFFRRTLWQISNGMRAGSEMEIVIRESISALNDEKVLQIQNYGGKLNPLVVFYMLLAVIIPALGITFLTIIASMIGLERTESILLYIGLFIMVVFVQIMFLGIIKSRRPSLI